MKHGRERVDREVTYDVVIDLTEQPIAHAAQLTVDELSSTYGGGPWCVVGPDGAVIAASGPLSPEPVTSIPLGSHGLRLSVADRTDDATGTEGSPLHEARCQAAVARLGDLLDEVIATHERAAVAEARAAQAERTATTDPLTGVANQGEWWRRVDEIEHQLERRPRDIVIAVVDIDGLKAVNDTRGHLHGDHLIVLVAETLTRAVRAGDIVARIGGDEFAVLAFDHTAPPVVLERQLSDALAAAGARASVGAAGRPPHRTLRAAFAVADQAMYATKQDHHPER